MGMVPPDAWGEGCAHDLTALVPTNAQRRKKEEKKQLELPTPSASPCPGLVIPIKAGTAMLTRHTPRPAPSTWPDLRHSPQGPSHPSSPGDGQSCSMRAELVPDGQGGVAAPQTSLGKTSPLQSQPQLCLLLLSPSPLSSLSSHCNAVFPQSLSNKKTPRAPRVGLHGWEAATPTPVTAPFPTPSSNRCCAKFCLQPFHGALQTPQQPQGPTPRHPQSLPPGCSTRVGRVRKLSRGAGRDHHPCGHQLLGNLSLAPRHEDRFL